MICPKCQTENRYVRKFCSECGAKLILICPKCDSENLPTEKFCGECGHSLSVEAPPKPPPKDLTFEEKLAKIQKYLPANITENILSQRDRIEGERKEVSVLFIDMAGYTSMTEKFDPEEAYSLMDQVYELLIHKINEYGGTVNEFTGDGVMALFGAPIAQEDAPQRTIRASLAIHREIVQLNEKMLLEKPGLTPLKMRAGIHTGPVVMGTLGNDLRVDFTAVGDTVNLASRMESLAEPGTTYVTEETFKLTEGFFSFEPLGQRPIKGRETPTNVYRVLGAGTSRTRFDVSVGRGLTPLVGRRRELELLLDGLTRIKEGRGETFLLTGDPGAGKTRLLYEFRKAAANEDMGFWQGRCLAYSAGTAYTPFAEALRSGFEIYEEDSNTQVRDKVLSGLRSRGIDEPWIFPHLLEVLSIQGSGIEQIPMSPEARRDCITEALNRVVFRSAEIQPLILVIEDLHWIDRSSEDYLRQLMEKATHGSLFILLSCRSEFARGWIGLPYENPLNLSRLSRQESLSMAALLLGTDKMDRDLRRMILEKTDGIPLYIEEFIQSLKDLGLVEGQEGSFSLMPDRKPMFVPATIRDVIMARVDSLPPGAKDLLQTCAVIEREFGRQLIRTVTKKPEEEITSHLKDLRRSGLIEERRAHPEATYAFRHALTREVVYETILGKRKRGLHETIAQTLETTYQTALEEHCEALAHHFMASEDFEKGAKYSWLAARKAERSSSLMEAIDHARKRVTCIEKLPETPDRSRTLVDARTTLALYLSQMSYVTEAKEAVDPIVELAQQLGYERRLAQIHALMGSYHLMVQEEFEPAFEELQVALNMAEKNKESLTIHLINGALGLALVWDCRFQEAAVHLQRVIDTNAASNNLWGVSITNSNLSLYAYNYTGQVDLGYHISQEALRTAEQCGDILSRAIAYTSHGISGLHKGLLEEGKKHLLAGIELCQKINLFAFNSVGHQWLGYAYADTGDYVSARVHYEEAARFRERSRTFLSSLYLSRIAAVSASVMLGVKEVDLGALRELVAKTRLRLHQGIMARFLGEILLHLNDQNLDEAEHWIRTAEETHERCGMVWNLARDQAIHGELLQKRGDVARAREMIMRAARIFAECGAPEWARRMETGLSRL
jgi:class 3 adenylate cyclase/tetratricopeptide (TPR) repeat protein